MSTFEIEQRNHGIAMINALEQDINNGNSENLSSPLHSVYISRYFISGASQSDINPIPYV